MLPYQPKHTFSLEKLTYLSKLARSLQSIGSPNISQTASLRVADKGALKLQDIMKQCCCQNAVTAPT